MPKSNFSKEASLKVQPQTATKSTSGEEVARVRTRKPKPGSKKAQDAALLAPPPMSVGRHHPQPDPGPNPWSLNRQEDRILDIQQTAESLEEFFTNNPEELPDADPFDLGPLDEGPVYNKRGKFIRQFHDLDKDMYNRQNCDILVKRYGWPPAVRAEFERLEKRGPSKKGLSLGAAALKDSRHNWSLDRKRWVVPYSTGSPLVPRPRVYSVRGYRAWANGQAAVLGDWLTKQTSAWRKRQYVSGNLAAQYLWDGARPASDRERNYMLTKAAFYIADYNAPPSKEVPHPRLIEFTTSPSGPLFIKSDVLEKEDLADPTLRKNKPIARQVSAYLAGSRSVPRQVIQSSLDRLVFQGLFDSKIEMRHQFEIMFPEVDTVANTLGLTEERVRKYVSLTALIVGVFSAENLMSVGSLFTMYFVNDAKALTYCMALLRSIPDRLQLQGALSMFQDYIYYPLWEAVTSAGVFTLLQEFPKEVCSMFVPLMKEMVELTRKGLKKETATAVARYVLEWISTIFGRIKLCISTRSLAPIWGAKWDPRKWDAYAQGYQQYYVQLTIQADAAPSTVETVRRLREEGHIPSDWTTPVPVTEFLVRCKEHLAQGDELLRYFNQQPTISSMISRGRDKLQSFVATTEIQATGVVERVQPIFIYVHGPPGVGKTNVVRQMAKAIGRSHGFSIESDGIYDFQGGGVNFQDGFMHTHWCVIMDDIDQSVAAPASGSRSHCEEVVALVNNKPYSVEQAELSMKGKVRASPLVVFYCSNFYNGLAPQYLRDPHAFWRRITYHVTVAVKPEFATPQGLLDVKAARESETHEMYDFSVRTYLKNADDRFEFLGEARKMGTSALFKLCQKAFRDQLVRQTKLLQLRAALPAACSSCGLDTTKACECQFLPVEYQGFMDVYAKCRTTCYIGWMSFATRFVTPLFRGLLHPPFRTLSLEWAIQRTVEAELRDMMVKLGLAVGGVALVSYGLVAISRILDVTEQTELQGRVANAGEVNVPSNWVRADQTFTPAIPSFGKATFTKEDAIRAITESHCTVCADTTETMHAFVVAPSCILLPTHLFKGANSAQVTQSHTGTTVEAAISSSTFYTLPSNPQLAVLYVPGLSGVVGIQKKMMAGVDESIQTFDQVEIFGRSIAHSPTTNQVVKNFGTKVLSTNANTRMGDCGMVYLARHNESWKIAGMHYALNITTSSRGETATSIAGLTSAMEIAKVCAHFAQTPAQVTMVMQSVAKVPSSVQLGRFGARSEIWAATSAGAKVAAYGQLTPALPGSTLKTKIESSLFRPDLAEMEIEHCGCVGYWGPPNFRGSMKGDQWVSPFTNMFVTQNLVQPDQDLMILALLDYVSEMDKLDYSGYSVLTEEEAMSGVSGSYVNGVNMKTSVGPPYCVGKQQHASVSKEGSWISDNVASMSDEIEEVLEEGGIPSVVGLCSLKDEAVKLLRVVDTGEADAADGPRKPPRVFICLPFSMNLVLKRYGSPWKSFMRGNPEFFESAVGINMTSAECNRVPRFLATVNPALDKVYDGDLKAMDKSWSPAMFDFVSQAVFVICSLLGTEPDKNRRLILAMKHVTYSVKNDLFRACMNPSGCDATVELNGMCLSLCERYVYYRSNPFRGDMAVVRNWYANLLEKPEPPVIPELDFRKNVALVHYGDDNIKTMRIPPSPDYLSIWKDELGFVMTSAMSSKTVLTELVPAPITEVSFLKRMFVWDEELGFYIPPLDMKSITRMLVIKKDSVLTRSDHAAVVLTEAHREMVYHGEEAFEKFIITARGLAETHGLTNNPYLVLKSFAHWREQMKLDSFQTWSLRDSVPPVDLQLPLTFQSAMSELNLAEAPIEAPMVSQTLDLQHETGAIMSSSAVQTSETRETPTVHQQMPRTDLANFLMRPTYVSQTTLEDTDVTNTVIHSFDPWGTFMTTPFIQDKLNNYTYIRGTLQIIAVVTVPGGAYGRYVVSALPNAGPTAPTLTLAENLYPGNCMQVDHYGVIDGAEAESVVLQLPFVWAYDYASISGVGTPSPSAMWTVSTTCLQQLSTGVTGGLTRGYVKFYANLLDDFEITVPNFQGKRKLQANAAMKSHAPKIHAMIGEGKGSAMAGQIASIAESASSVPIIGQLATTVGQAARGAEMVMSWFGFTRTTEELAPIPITNRSVTNVAHFDGADSGDTAALSFTNEISIDARLNGFSGEDCLANADLFERWTRVGSFQWSTDDLSEANLYSIPVTPSYAYEAGQIHMTTAGYYGLPFEHWRGDMEYKIVIPVSKFHRGSLQLLWVTQGVLPGFDVTNAALNLIHDVSSGDDIEITIGYARERPYLLNRLITQSVPIIPYGSAANGFLVFRVINPLTAQAIATSTTVTIFARAKNMDFALPRDTLLFTDGIDPTEQDIMNTLVLQGALGDDGGVAEKAPFPLVPPSGPFPGDSLYFGEKVQSVRALLQKPSRLGARLVTDQELLRAPILPPSIIGAPAVWTWQGHYSPLYLGLAYSERYKIFPKTDCWVGMSRTTKTNAPGTTSTLAPMTFCGPNFGAEFNIPYYTPEKFRITRSLDQPIYGESVTRLNVYGRGETPVEVIPYYSYGPDIRATCFRQVPAVSFRASLGVNPWFA